MSRIIQKHYELACNKWTCGRCGEVGKPECPRFGGRRGSTRDYRGYNRLPACIAADTDLIPCEAGCRREATHTDGDGMKLCTPCWRALIKEAKAELAKGKV